MKQHTCFKRYGCSRCGSDYTDLWENEEHAFLRVEKIFLTNDKGVMRDCKLEAANPLFKATHIGFEGWIVEPGETKCNMWQFWIKENDEVWGRPCGASASSYRPAGTTKRRKPGEWYATPWVPKEAIQDCISKFVKT
jgi:hypothetical protein